MKRFITEKLMDWKVNPERKPLILNGARQVGKTWALKDFGRRYYKNMLYINCDDEPLLNTLFEEDYSMERILPALEAIAGEKINGSDTLIVLDEIQEAPRGLSFLKYVNEKAPYLHVAASGSLLGLALRKGDSFPVGKVDMLSLYPMNFAEFLIAAGQEKFYEILQSGDEKLITGLSTKYKDLLRQYYFVGGMPEVVSSWTTEKDIFKVRKKQKDILTAYRRDISKHAPKDDVVRIWQVLDSLPAQLAKENKKFIYSVIRQGARAKEFEVAIQWLIDAGFVYKCSRVNSGKKIKPPLKFYEDMSAFKLFYVDCGLLACMADAAPAHMLIGDNPFVEFKGAFTEQYVAQQLISRGITPYYWNTEKSTCEIDILFQYRDTLVPIEAKAEENVRAKSLRVFIENNPELYGVRCCMPGYDRQDWMYSLPLWAIYTEDFLTRDRL